MEAPRVCSTRRGLSSTSSSAYFEASSTVPMSVRHLEAKCKLVDMRRVLLQEQVRAFHRRKKKEDSPGNQSVWQTGSGAESGVAELRPPEAGAGESLV